MRAQMLVAALAGLSIAAAASAEPAKTPVREAEQPAENAAAVVVAAAASKAPAEAASDRPEQAPKQRRARVTSCRCGDQNPSD